MNPSKLCFNVRRDLTNTPGVTERDNPDARKEALSKLRLITDRIMLRRVKRDHTSSMELPPKRFVTSPPRCTKNNINVITVLFSITNSLERLNVISPRAL